MREIEKTKFYSRKLGNLPKGCDMCVKGEKLVLYITGICPRHCWYCPLSERRKDKDVIFVNEWKTNNKEDLIKEVKLGNSKGAGITGGDPLSKIDRTIEYISLLKERFGKSFHIHLYTSFILAKESNLKKLYDTGLDEIRFHPDFEKKKQWKSIENALKFDWDVGIEIPVVPKNKNDIIELCDYMDGKIKFLNLNEFEISDLNSDEMTKHGYNMKSDISHGIKGSEKTAKEIIEYCKNKSFSVHYCTSKLKDKVQMQNRFKLRAQNVKTKYDIITDEGLLLRGTIEIRELENRGIGDKELIENRNEILKELREKKRFLEEEGLEIYLDENKLRLITYPEHVQQFADTLKQLELIPAIIEEDPTVEAFVVNKDYL